MNAPVPTPLRTLLCAGGSALLLASGAAQAEHGDGDGFVARARVLSSAPVYDTVSEPRRECRTETTGHETHTYRNASNPGGAILGAIAGGLLGSTVGKGNGKVAAAAVGAATGAVVGDRWNDRGGYYSETRPVQMERCYTRSVTREELVGYDVRYRFQGRDYTTRLPYEPGEFLNLNVSFSVAQDQRPSAWKQSRNDRWEH
jgi:uncharacterized protein YcfJ